jgi:ubiquinone/menaquinone biosynthesis C-methylase UbiE
LARRSNTDLEGDDVTEEKQRKQVREGYARIAVKESSCCGGGATNRTSRKMGYSEDELEAVPEGANMGLGCGNPVALASLKEGEIVVDLGSGGGFDCFLGAKRVGKKGRVIGVDMTPEMLDKARQNARRGDYENVEFRLGEIENLPVADNTGDVVISNCVVNMAPNKKRVFEEALRVLKPGGRLMVSDLVLLKELPEEVKAGMDSTSCVTGAMMKDKYAETIKAVGFEQVRIIKEERYGSEDFADDPDAEVLVFNPKTKVTETKKVSELDEKAKEKLRITLEEVLSVNVSAIKP